MIKINDAKIVVRSETAEDYAEIESLVKEAFASAEHSDGDEHNLIDRIRQTEDYIPQLSLVAEMNGAIVGYIMFSRIYIGTEIAVAPAPLTVKTGFQRHGIGRLLVSTGHEIARNLQFPCSVVLGSPDYYTRLGYQRASEFNISAPFDVESKYYMVFRLTEETLPSGVVEYSEAFGL